MNSQKVEPEAVISELIRQIGQLSADLAVTRAALDAALNRLSEMETGEPPSAG